MPLEQGRQVAGDEASGAVQGLTDLGVSGIYAMNGSESRDGGRAFVVSGGTCGERDVDETPTLSGASDEGASVALTGLGDVDGDGWDDLAVGAPTHTWHNTSVLPRVYVVHGPFTADASLGDVAEATLWADSSSTGFGGSISSTDVTGDGTADLLVGARGYPDWSGSVFLYEGPVTGELSTGDAHARLAGDGYTSMTCVVGDVDGDGQDEFAAGEYGYSDERGALTLLTGPLEGEIDLTGQAARAVGAAAGDRMGAACDGLDWNGDGYADLVGMSAGVGETRIWLSEGSLPASLELEADLLVGPTTDHEGSVYGTLKALGDLDRDG
ncbi:MAG: VCBS repeat-containing protein, partial [Proteobacteria bacterium]|nr:VCBS repeat-containing protein [Pseudomonadota bacterium]